MSHRKRFTLRTGSHWFGIHLPVGVGYSASEQRPPNFVIHWNGSFGCGQQSATRAILPVTNFPALIAFKLSITSTKTIRDKIKFVHVYSYLKYLPTAATATGFPIWPWFLTGEITSFVRQSNEAGKSFKLISLSLISRKLYLVFSHVNDESLVAIPKTASKTMS